MKVNRQQIRNARLAVLLIWESTPAEGTLDQLRDMLARIAPFCSSEDLEYWLECNLDSYYRLKRVEDDLKDNEHIKKVLEGAGFKF